MSIDRAEGLERELATVPAPFHRWAINEDPGAPSVHLTSSGQPDHCLVCGVVRYPLTRWGQAIAAGPCIGRDPGELWPG